MLMLPLTAPLFVAAAAVIPIPDVGYEETVPVRWAVDGVASPFPAIRGLLRTRSVAAAGPAALALDARGASVALPSVSTGIPALWDWIQPEPPRLQRALATAGSCTASIVGAEDTGMVQGY
jgi:hypothetical protein